jgi:acyl carrier protein phosphodiesterase
MNFLAHAYLSFHDPQVLTGNMISDFVKGKQQYSFPAAIQKGIRLHRAIDEFTDHHPVTQEAKQVFRAAYRLYSGALVDIIYDHYLATDATIFEDAALLQFSEGVYAHLEQQAADLPDRFLNLLPYMKADNWLYQYKERAMIRKSLRGLVRRSTFLSDSETAFQLFEQEYELLKDCYNRFFPELERYARLKFLDLAG